MTSGEHTEVWIPKTRVFLAIIAATWTGGCDSQPMAVTHDENGKQQSANK
jgi:hypothetical protein